VDKDKNIKDGKSVSGKRAPKKIRQGGTPPAAENKVKRPNITPQTYHAKKPAAPSSVINPYKKTTTNSRNVGNASSRSSATVTTTKSRSPAISSHTSSSAKSVIVPSSEPALSKSAVRYKPITVAKKAVSYEEDYSVGAGESSEVLPSQESQVVHPPQHNEFEEDTVPISSNEHFGEQGNFENISSVQKTSISAVSFILRVAKIIGMAVFVSLVLVMTFNVTSKLLSDDTAVTENEKKATDAIPPCFIDRFENLSELEKMFDGANFTISDPATRNYTDRAGNAAECRPTTIDGNLSPCPAGGRCYEGFLIDCKAELSFSADQIGTDLLHVSADNRSCELTDVGQQLLSKIQSSVSSLTIDHICNCGTLLPAWIGGNTCSAKDAFVKTDHGEQPVILFSASSILKNLLESLANTDGEMSSDIQWSLVDGQMIERLVVFGGDYQLFFDSENSALGFTTEYMNSRISLPFSCWAQIILLDAVSFLWGLSVQAALNVFGVLFQITTTHPFLSLCAVCILWIMNFIRKHKQKKEVERSQIVEIRESAYDMLIHAEESYAVVHLRDTIMHKMFPMSLKERKAASLKLWPKVMKDVQHDSRVRKIEKNVMGSRQEHWEWISVPARKQRLSSAATPVRPYHSTSDSKSPSLEELKKNLL